MSNYLNSAITTRQQLKDWLERKLGAPLVVVEITPEQLDDAIDETLEIYTRYVTPEEVYMTIDLKTYPASGLTLPDNITSIYNMGTSSVGSGNDGTLFSVRSQLRNEIGMDISFGVGSWTTYQAAMEYLELANRLLGGSYQFRYNNKSKVFQLTPNPQTIHDTGHIVISCRAVRPEDQLLGEPWIKRYALALCKQVVGHVRGRFANVQLLGGANNEDYMREEGKQEMTDLLNELIETETLPPDFYVG